MKTHRSALSNSPEFPTRWLPFPANLISQAPPEPAPADAQAVASDRHCWQAASAGECFQYSRRPLPSFLQVGRATMPGRTLWQNQIHPMDQTNVKAQIESALQSRRTTSIKYRMLDLHGDAHWILDTFYFDPDSHQFLGCLVLALDAGPTEREPCNVCCHTEDMAFEFSRHLLKQNDDLRCELALALHDDVLSGLATLKLRLESLIDRGEMVAVTPLAELRDSLAELTERARTVAHQTWPPELVALGLQESIFILIEQMQSQGRLPVELNIVRPLPEVPHHLAIAIYRVIQEGLTNVLKHSRATHCWVRIENRGNSISLSIRDNGIGLQVSKDRDATRSFGLVGIKQRVQAAGGHVSFDRPEAGGTELLAAIPLARG